MEHSILRKVWPTVAPPMSCTKVVMLWPAERVLRGWISLHTSQARGPHPHANPAMNMQTCRQPTLGFCSSFVHHLWLSAGSKMPATDKQREVWGSMQMQGPQPHANPAMNIHTCRQPTLGFCASLVHDRWLTVLVCEQCML